MGPQGSILVTFGSIFDHFWHHLVTILVTFRHVLAHFGARLFFPSKNKENRKILRSVTAKITQLPKENRKARISATANIVQFPKENRKTRISVTANKVLTNVRARIYLSPWLLD